MTAMTGPMLTRATKGATDPRAKAARLAAAFAGARRLWARQLRAPQLSGE
jgi:hypothetical protein